MPCRSIETEDFHYLCIHMALPVVIVYLCGLVLVTVATSRSQCVLMEVIH